MEWICVRIESEDGIKICKEKNFLFGVLEGYFKEKDSYIDTKEVN